jgi:hypothetical protein
MESTPTQQSPIDPTPAEFFCPECGYDLRAIASDRCPECGLAIDRAAMVVSRLPWAHRRKVGRVRAYWRTNLMALFRPRKIAEEMARPVSFADSQSFRHVTVMLGWLPMVAWAISLIVMNMDDLTARVHQGSRLGWWLEGIAAVAGLFSLWLFLFMGSGVGSYFFHPRRMPVVLQNRAVALSYYACAPFAWLWLPAVLFDVLAAIVTHDDWMGPRLQDTAMKCTMIASCVTLGGIVIQCYGCVSKLMLRTIRCGPARMIALTVYLPIAWALVAAIALAVPATIVYISLVILSLR